MNLVQRIGLALLGGEQKARDSGPHVSTYHSGIPAINYEWTAENATREGLQKSSPLYVAVTIKARAFASVPIIVEKRKRGGKWEADAAHPLQRLLDRPNPHMSRQDMMERWAQHMELAGNALWHKVKAVRGPTLELWPVNPDVIFPIPDRTEYLRGYEYRPTPQDRLTLPVNEVLHWQYQNPSNTYWGLAPVRAAALTIDGDVEAVKWNRTILANGARPAGVVTLDAAMSDDQWRAARQMIQEQTGGAANARQFLAFGGATSVTAFGFDASDMDWANGRKMNRDEIFSVIGVPAILAVQGEGSTYANMESAERAFWTRTLIPLLDDFCRTLEASLLAEFGAETTHRIRADLSNVPALRENEGERAKVALTLTQAGFSSESVAEHLQLPLKTAAQLQTEQAAQTAVKALRTLTPHARAWVEGQAGRSLKGLTPPDVLSVALALASPEPGHALQQIEWEPHDE